MGKTIFERILILGIFLLTMKSVYSNLDNVSYCDCSLTFDPFIGTEGQTYSNMCKLACDQEDNSELQIKHDGSFEGDDPVSFHSQ